MQRGCRGCCAHPHLPQGHSTHTAPNTPKPSLPAWPLALQGGDIPPHTPQLVIPSPLIELSAEGQCGGGEGGGRGDSAAAGGERRTLSAAAPPGLRGPCGGSGPPVPGEGHDFGNFSEPGHPQQGDSPSVSTATGIKYNLQRARSPRSHPSIARPPERPPPRLLPFDLKPTQPSQSP